ncbi:MAG TPA: A/G-specific adenine glycosylase [Steroidobacteraceae bacterium]|nr:A/G-specific adenine glycosylase [Steroidobacteraceae bacterium]
MTGPTDSVSRPSANVFADALLEWHAREGRHDLPWQHNRTPYRVWVSEIMLQQTQVSTVIPYYERFMARFPGVQALADAPIDDVLHLWSGLGYYARARNMHRAAVRIRDELDGLFPTTFDAIAGLPGIGRSTAGAILALSEGQRFPILDGNVKRVLSRYFGVAGGSERSVLDRLWQLSEDCTPDIRVDVYTQAVMDLGATVCTRHKPLCAYCPLTEDCFARATGRQSELPPPRKAKGKRRSRHVYMLVAMRGDGSVLLERRPESGVWGGLWCLPQFDTATAASIYAGRALARQEVEAKPLTTVEHAFTHFDLVMTPLLVSCSGDPSVMDEDRTVWYNTRQPARIGLPAPIRTLLDELASPTLFDES